MDCVEWKEIPYATNYEAGTNGEIRNKKNKRVLKPAVINSGYNTVCLRINKKSRNFLVHRIILDTFSPNPDPMIYTDVNHKNFRKNDNRLKNLEWMTRVENIRYTVDNSDSFIQNRILRKVIREFLIDVLKFKEEDIIEFLQPYP